MNENIVNFQLFSPLHWGLMFFTVLAPLLLGMAVNRAGGAKTAMIVARILVVMLLGGEVVQDCYSFCTQPSFQDFYRRSLPFHLCDFGMILTAVYMWCYPRRLQRIFEVAFFWSVAGAIPAMLTPDLPADYPSFGFWQFYVSHMLIVVCNVYAIVSLRYRPRAAGILWAWLATNVVFVIVAAINLLLRSNYFFICHPPQTAMPLFFLPWPWYVVFMEFLTPVFFLVVYLPFGLAAGMVRRGICGLHSAGRNVIIARDSDKRK
ncbi:MAG TPA: TIGR02206 family membrane protein [Phycisphaerae bacterium]|nr:TIGR02206 family membrane protein [Phycisphaerae bacterium]HPS53509.1 TIGR02206 family membrane protein [Phycisphaerae bacterium]